MNTFCRSQRGAALLLAMLILTLVSTVAAGMIWHQHRAVEVEAAERARTQGGWILAGALDWARLILREDARTPDSADHLGEPWAVPLAEARLSTFLAADRDNTLDSSLDAFLSGSIVDVQARYNLRNLVGPENKPLEAEVAGFKRMCQALGLAQDVPLRIVEGLVAAWGGGSSTGPLAPTRPAQLQWLGIDAASAARLEPYVAILPVRTAVNVNTAPREVLLAAIDGLDLGGAEQIVKSRQNSPFLKAEQLSAALPQGLTVDAARIGIASRFFEVTGRLRLDERVVTEHSLVERRPGGGGLQVVLLRRERTGPPQARR